MKKQKCIALLAGAALVAASVQAQLLEITWDGGTTPTNWSDAANWSTAFVPNSNTQQVRIVNPGGSINVNVDGDYTVGQIYKTFSSYDPGVFLFDGPGTLTLDGDTVVDHQGGSDIIPNAIEFGGNVVLTNSSAGSTSFSIQNGDENVIRFNSSSTLTLDTLLILNDDSHGKVEFNGTLLGSDNMRLDVANNYIGAGFDDSGWGGTHVFTGNSGLTINGGNVTQDLQVNSGPMDLVLNAENAVNGSNFRMEDGLITVNASQNNLGYLRLKEDNALLTIDTVGGGLAFADSSGETWNAGHTLTITNFTAGSISFGSDATGLTAGQLAVITAYDSSGSEVTGLSLDGSGALIPEPSTIGLIAVSGLGLLVARRMRM